MNPRFIQHVQSGLLFIVFIAHQPRMKVTNNAWLLTDILCGFRFSLSLHPASFVWPYVEIENKSSMFSSFPCLLARWKTKQREGLNNANPQCHCALSVVYGRKSCECSLENQSAGENFELFLIAFCVSWGWFVSKVGWLACLFLFMVFYQKIVGDSSKRAFERSIERKPQHSWEMHDKVPLTSCDQFPAQVPFLSRYFFSKKLCQPLTSAALPLRRLQFVFHSITKWELKSEYAFYDSWFRWIETL
jgi:hypothetical protein